MTKETPPLSVGHILIGPLFNEPMRGETVQSNGAANWIVGLVGANSERFRKVTMTAEDLLRLTVLDPQHSFNGDGRLLRLGLQAYALGIAYEFDRISACRFRVSKSFTRLPVFRATLEQLTKIAARLQAPAQT